MSIHQFLLILLARKKTIVATLLLTTALAVGFGLMQDKTYKATASVLLNYKGVDPLTGMTMPGQLLPGYMATQVDIIGSKNVALRVVDALHLAGNPAVARQFRATTEGRGAVRDWLADLLLRKLEIVPARESSVVEISFMGTDPVFAATVANAFADEYQKITVQLKADPARRRPRTSTTRRGSCATTSKPRRPACRGISRKRGSSAWTTAAPMSSWCA